MILLIDNFDSFTYNLADYILQEGIECDIRRNDFNYQALDIRNYAGIVLSPGPGSPESTGSLMKIIDAFHQKLPMLGVCLGHQALGQYFGARVKKAQRPMHGKISEIQCSNDPLFQNLPSRFNVVRYHSLILHDLPPCLETLAATETGEIMAMRHKALPIWGVQYHPEAVLTEFGKEILKNWIFLQNITH